MGNLILVKLGADLLDFNKPNVALLPILSPNLANRQNRAETGDFTDELAHLRCESESQKMNDIEIDHVKEFDCLLLLTHCGQSLLIRC